MAREPQTWWLVIDYITDNRHRRNVAGPFPSKRATRRAKWKRTDKILTSAFITDETSYDPRAGVNKGQY